jgi:hypothetical protein
MLFSTLDMRYAIVLAAIVAIGVNAQDPPMASPPPKAKCQKTADIKPVADPLVQFTPGSATFPCDMGAPIPLGKIPTGCAKLEVIVGRLPVPL